MYSVEELKNILKGNNLPDTENNIKLLSEGLDNGRFILEDAVNLDETVNYMTEMYDKETLVKILKEEYETYNTLLEMSDEDFETYIMEASDDEFNEACLLLESDMYLINEENLAENEVLDSINLLTESVGDIRKRIRLGLSSLGIGGAAAGATIAANGVNPVAVPIATGLGAAGVAYGVHKLGKQIVDTNKARSNYATKNAANIAAKFRRDDGTSPVSEDDIKGYGLGKREMVKRAKANAKVEWLKNHGDERTKTQQNLRQSQKNLKIASKHLKNDNTGVAQQMMNQEQKKIDSAKAALKNYKNKEKEAVGNAAFNAKNDFKKAKEATKYYAQANGEGKKLSFWANHKNDLTENLSVD